MDESANKDPEKKASTTVNHVAVDGESLVDTFSSAVSQM